MKVPSLEEFDYVLKEERDLPPEDQTVFRLRPLKFKERREVERSEYTVRGQGEIVFLADRLGVAQKILNFGLVGWSNLRGPDGAEVEFRKVDEGGRKILPAEVLDGLEPYVNEIANAVTERSTLPKEAAKNS